MAASISSSGPSYQTYPAYSDFGSDSESESESEPESESTLAGGGSTVGAGSGVGAVSSSKRAGQMMRNVGRTIVHPRKTREKRAAKREQRENDEMERVRDIDEFLESGRHGPVVPRRTGGGGGRRVGGCGAGSYRLGE